MKTSVNQFGTLILIGILFSFGYGLQSIAHAQANWNTRSFFQLIMKTNTETNVKKELGMPAAVEEYNGVKIYLYDLSVSDSNESVKPAIHFVDGRVNTINYVSAGEMAQRIQMAKIRTQAKTATKEGKKTYTPAEIYSLTQYRTPAEMIGILGEPSKKQTMNGKEVWTYPQLVSSNGKLWDQHFQFEYGRVNYTWVEQSK